MSDKGKENDTAQQLAGLNISTSPSRRAPPPAQPPKQPPRPVQQPVEEEDDDDPFADSNAVATPSVEKREPAW